MKYDEVKNGEGFEVKQGETFLLECGDCGCVRKGAIALEESGNFGIAFEVDEKKTTARRRLRSTKEKIRNLATILPKDLVATILEPEE